MDIRCFCSQVSEKKEDLGSSDRMPWLCGGGPAK